MVSVNDPIVKLFYHAKEMTILRNGTVGTRLIFLQSKLRSPYNRKLNSTARTLLVLVPVMKTYT